MMLAVTATGLAGPLIVSTAIDRHIAGHDPGGLALAVGLYVLVQIAGWLATSAQTWTMGAVGQRVVYRIREDIHGHLQTLGLDYFDARPAGVIMSRVTNDVNALGELISSGLVHVVTDLITLAGIVVIMVQRDAVLTLLTLTTVPFLIYAATAFRGRVLRAYRRVRTAVADVNANLQESISGVRVTQSFVRERDNLGRFDRTNLENLQANMQAVSLFSAFMPTVELIGAAGTALILWYGGLELGRGTLTVGTLYLFLTFQGRFYQPIRDLAHIYNVMQSAMAACEKIFGVLDSRPNVGDRPGALAPAEIAGRVTFEGVTFGYDPARPVLEDISFDVLPGWRVALVGPTGAGKTTVVNLVARFYDPEKGRVCVDGVDIRDLSLEAYRARLGIVLQDTYLFSGTILDNIRYGRPQASGEEVIRAARAVGAHEFIASLPEGYRTEVGERGAALSAGQRQLVAFARALLRDPRILILDEATSSVDAATEDVIRRGLKTLVAGRTSFIIAHRLSAVEEADIILVLDGGRIVERGRHDELVARDGLYARLYRLQAGTAAVGPDWLPDGDGVLA